jgi:predicted small lipoprotein YifL
MLKPQIKNMVVALALLSAAACASKQPVYTASSDKIQSDGPTIVYVHSEPQVVQLNRDRQPLQSPEVFADVKDFKSVITSVTLQFENTPIIIPMENVSGTTWRAELTPSQIELLSVSGKTAHYNAIVKARNAEGKTATSPNPVTVAIQTPDLGKQPA